MVEENTRCNFVPDFHSLKDSVQLFDRTCCSFEDKVGFVGTEYGVLDWGPMT